MKLRTLTIGGFRGFNIPRTLVFGNRLTVVHAPNSYGKTSIAEALEFLLFGKTSKVEDALSKEEFKDSYRNRHLAAPDDAVIEAVFETAGGGLLTLRRTLTSSGEVASFLNGAVVDEWPFMTDLASGASPFVIQHALKRLLLVSPQERFVGFAQLLGLTRVDVVYRAITSLCTKPEVALSSRASKHLEGLAQLEAGMSAVPALKTVSTGLKKGLPTFEEALAVAQKLAATICRPAPNEDLLTALARVRAERTKHVYAGDPQIRPLPPAEASAHSRALAQLGLVAGQSTLDDVTKLSRSSAIARLQREVDFLGTGTEFLSEDPSKCPLCDTVDPTGALATHIKAKHASALGRLPEAPARSLRTDVLNRLSLAREALDTNWKLQRPRTSDLVDVLKDENSIKIKALLATDETDAADTLMRAATALGSAEQDVIDSRRRAREAVEACEEALRVGTEQVAHAEAVVSSLQRHLAALRSWSEKVEGAAPAVFAASGVLKLAVDAKAGTEELTQLARFLERPEAVRRAVKLRDLLDGLKTLKGNAQQSLGEFMEAAFDQKLTLAVLRWYKMIRTSGDPDVHFDGFAMERTKAGDYKNAKVRISAKSYGVELASAVSSLSESKLNALGLCVSIATAVTNGGPCEFLILDDPIQSWDMEHEQQFIEVVRELAVSEGRQVVLLSHRGNWINTVTEGCRSIGGVRYEMTGYTKAGPTIVEREWMPIDERLKGILRIVENNGATTIELQQAEADVRLATHDIVARAVKSKLKRSRDASQLNKKDVRSLLSEMSCPPTLVDRIAATFGTSDDAHHVPTDYEPDRQRLRKLHGAVVELKMWAEA